jgi:PhoPQ-activated pathogenicity-related protein
MRKSIRYEERIYKLDINTRTGYIHNSKDYSDLIVALKKRVECQATEYAAINCSSREDMIQEVWLRTLQMFNTYDINNPIKASFQTYMQSQLKMLLSDGHHPKRDEQNGNPIARIDYNSDTLADMNTAPSNIPGLHRHIKPPKKTNHADTNEE